MPWSPTSPDPPPTLEVPGWFAVLILSGVGAIPSGEAFGTPLVALLHRIFPTGIPSAEAFGNLLVAYLQGISPAGIASQEAFGTSVVTPGAVAIGPSSITSAEAFGTPALSYIVAPTGIASAEAFGAVNLIYSQALAPTGIPSAEAFGVATATRGAVTVTTTGIASAEAFGTATVGRGPVTVAPTGIASAEAFGTPLVTATVKIETLTETFATEDSTKWRWDQGDLSSSATGGQCLLPANASYSALIDTVGKANYDLVASSFFLKAVQMPNLGNGTTEASVELRLDDNNKVLFVKSGSLLYFRETVGGTHSDTTLTYDPVAHRWWRLRESGGTVFWDTSPDGLASTWTNRRSKATSLVLRPLYVLLNSGYYGTEPSPGTAIFDHVNIPTQGVTPTGIASGEAFGTATVTRTPVPVTIVGVSAIGTTSATVPAHQIGDMLLVCSVRLNANTLPVKPAAGGTVPTFTDIDAATGTNSTSGRTAFAVATATNHTTGVWTNSAAMVVIVLRGQHASPIGGHAESGTASSATSTAPAITVADTSGNSKIIHIHSSVAGNSSFNGTPSTGYTRVSASANLMVVNSKNNTTTDGTANQTMAGGATFNRCAAVEVMAAP